jgi:exopolyphosphatase/guanosine-5'-triphosphate,3'-diphosphate pyrophosphatase
MRLGVLDVGSNTVHLLVADARRGAPVRPVHSEKKVLLLAERVGRDGALTGAGVDALVAAVAQARLSAQRLGSADLLALATSAVRDATNAPDVLARVRAETGVRLQALSGTDEARLTFLAVRRWFGWSAGRLLVLDIGGGSLELAAGPDEEPECALSLPLGAGRLTREWFATGPDADAVPAPAVVAQLEEHVERILGPALEEVTRTGWDRVAATSSTFRTLARLAGAAPSAAGIRVRRELTRTGLREVATLVRHVPPARLAKLDGVGARRAHQLLAGAVVAEAVLRRLGVESLDICPWALREGAILHRVDQVAPSPPAVVG